MFLFVVIAKVAETIIQLQFLGASNSMLVVLEFVARFRFLLQLNVAKLGLASQCLLSNKGVCIGMLLYGFRVGNFERNRAAGVSAGIILYRSTANSFTRESFMSYC